MPVVMKSLARKRAQPRVSRRFLLEWVDVCRQREATTPSSAVDVSQEDFLRAQYENEKTRN
jgi:hypothetical protein